MPVRSANGLLTLYIDFNMIGGSILAREKRGSIQKLGRGTYRVWYYDATGKRRSEVVHGGKRDALACLAAHQDAPPEAPTKPSTSLTVERFYIDIYHPHLIQRGLAPRTIEGYESQWKRAKPIFGDCDMSTLRARDIEARIQALPTAGQQQAVYKIMRQLFSYAYRLEYVDANPMTRKIERSKRFDYYRRPTYSPSEARAVLEQATDYIYYRAVVLCLCGGLRRSEALGLLWTDVERVGDGVIVHVSKTWQRKRGTLGAEAPTKTARSARDVIIPAPYCDALDPAEREPMHGVVAEPRPNPDRVTRTWKAYCETHGIRYVSLQGMRATYSTILAGAGVSDAVVSDTMGHSVLSTRYRHYLDASQEARQGVASALRDAIGNGTK